jgi:ankyrin repeat protein
MAAREGHASTVRLLLTTAHSLGVEFDSRNCFGETPLRLAAERESEEVVSMLLDAGADPLSKTADRITPLRAAAEMGHADVVRLFLATGRIGLEDMNAALESAEESGRSEVFVILQAAGRHWVHLRVK